MSVQNSYNNYIKRQKQTSSNNFRQKVANSLGGTTVGNNTTKKTNGLLGKQVSTIGTGITPKPTTTTPQATTSTVNPYSINQRIFTPTSPQNVLQSNIQALNTTSVPQQTVATQVTPQATNIPVENNSVPVEGTGMMSLSDINKAISSSRATSTENKTKTPEEYALEIYENQKKQNQADWEQKQAQYDLQYKQLQEDYNQSQLDAENAYSEGKTDLEDARYIQQENLNVSGQKRGIQYSPQQLALENVANINHNKNLATLSKQRNELLNELLIKLNQSLANISMNSQQANVDYNNSLAELNNNYLNTIMNWNRDDIVTKEDREFQEKMQNAQNKWQSNENALDRKSSKSSSGYYSSGYGGYGGYSSGSSYTPYTPYNSYSSSRSLDLDDDTNANTVLQTSREALTDLYNAIDYAGMNELDNKGKAYNSVYNDIVNQIKNNTTNSSRVLDTLEDVYDTGLKHLYNKSYARSTNTPYLQNGVKYTPSTPYNQDYINKTKSTKQLDKADFYSKYASSEKKRKQAKTNKNFAISTGQGLTLEDLQKFNNSKKSSKSTKSNVKKTSKNSTYQKYNNGQSAFTYTLKNNKSNKSTKSSKSTQSKVSKSLANSKKNTYKSSANSKKNYTKSLANSKKNVSKSVANSKKNLSKSISKSWSNFKKNLKKLFS